MTTSSSKPSWFHQHAILLIAMMYGISCGPAISFFSSFSTVEFIFAFIFLVSTGNTLRIRKHEIMKITFGKQYLTRLFFLFLYHIQDPDYKHWIRCRPREQWTFMFFTPYAYQPCSDINFCVAVAVVDELFHVTHCMRMWDFVLFMQFQNDGSRSSKCMK